MSESRKHILEKIKKGIEKKTHSETPDFSSPIYKEITPNKAECFKQELETVSGKCTICDSVDEVYKNIINDMKQEGIAELFCKDSEIQKDLVKNSISYQDDADSFTKMKAAITRCELLVARTGSVVVSSNSESGRQLNFFPPTHIIIAKETQLVEYVEDALIALQEKYNTQDFPSMVSLISGPSRTADIEKTLVLGAHGPKALYVYIYE